MLKLSKLLRFRRLSKHFRNHNLFSPIRLLNKTPLSLRVTYRSRRKSQKRKEKAKQCLLKLTSLRVRTQWSKWLELCKPKEIWKGLSISKKLDFLLLKSRPKKASLINWKMLLWVWMVLHLTRITLLLEIQKALLPVITTTKLSVLQILLIKFT